MTEELKPCPKCGYEHVYIECAYGGDGLMYVKCDCGIESLVSHNEKEVIEEWNNRK